MKNLELKGKVRKDTGKEVCAKLRREGFIPGVVYGKNPSVSVTVEVKSLLQILKKAGDNALLRLNLEGEERNDRQVIVRELQIHPLARVPLHADFYEVSMDQEIEVAVPLRTVGELEESVQAGFLINLLLKEARVECLPGQIPEEIEVDISGLVEGNAIHVKDLTVPEGVQLLHDPDDVVLRLSFARVLEEEEEAEAAGEEEESPAEPEVVGKGPKTTEE
mgnify:CR=1 FL=1